MADEIFRILDRVTNALAVGEGITVVPHGATMTTQQVPGRHRRARLEDLVSYQARFRAERRAALRAQQQASVTAKIWVAIRAA